MKVQYVMLNGKRSTAYTDDHPVKEGSLVYHGVNKYTDEDVYLMWDGRVWRQTLSAM